MEFPLEDDDTEAPAADDATPTSDEVGGVSDATPTSDEVGGVTDADLATCVRVLTALGADDGEFHSPRCKSLRVAMQPFLEDIRGKLFHGQAVDKYRQRKENGRRRHARAEQERAQDAAWANKTVMRAERMRMLQELGDGDGAPRVPDGAVEAAPLRLCASADGAAASAAADSADAPAEPELHEARSCYTCKARFRKLHAFYAQLCPECAALNWAKREQSADLRGRFALVTGSRVKIGYQVVLKLLRAGATVLATTRFPVDAAARFAAAPDFAEWRDRLQVVGLDLRDLRALEMFCAHLVATQPRVDIIINNACQTVRRPPRYYAPLIERELAWAAGDGGGGSDGGPTRALLQTQSACFGDAAAAVRALLPPSAAAAAPTPTAAPVVAAAGGAAATAVGGVWAGGGGDGGAVESLPSALWSQLPLWAPDGGDGATALAAGAGAAEDDDAAAFPVGATDVNGQQLDLRRVNSWRLKVGEVSTPEAAEVLAINALAPFVLNGRLRPLLEAAAAAHGAAFVVNVSAMEGKFYRYKTPNHPHTNMAKAALNMMTRTCAEELAAARVYMNSVDTGWINDENPQHMAAANAERHNFQTPLDEIDAAARVVDPVLAAANGAAPVHGQFLKDYAQTEW